MKWVQSRDPFLRKGSFLEVMNLGLSTKVGFPCDAQLTATYSSTHGRGTHRLARDRVHISLFFLQGTDYTFYKGQVPSNCGLQFRSCSLKPHEEDRLMRPEGPRPEEKSWHGRMGKEAGVSENAWGRGETRRVIFAAALWPKVTESAGTVGGQVSCYKRSIVLSTPVSWWHEFGSQTVGVGGGEGHVGDSLETFHC